MEELYEPMLSLAVLGQQPTHDKTTHFKDGDSEIGFTKDGLSMIRDAATRIR